MNGPIERSLLLDPVVPAGSAPGAIRMPVPVRAMPPEGSLAQFMARQGSEQAPSVRTEVPQPDVVVAEKIDQGTSPLVFEQSIVPEAESPVQSTVVPQPEPQPELQLESQPVMVEKTDQGTSPLAFEQSIAPEPESPVQSTGPGRAGPTSQWECKRTRAAILNVDGLHY